MDKPLQVELSRDQQDTMLMMAGLASGTAFRERLPELAKRFLRLINHINRNNPDWLPFEDDGGPNDQKNSNIESYRNQAFR